MKTRLFKYIENFTTKNENFQINISDIFHMSAQNINCGRVGSNMYTQSMLKQNNKNNVHVYSCKPQFYYIKMGFKVVKIIQVCFCHEQRRTFKKRAALEQSVGKLLRGAEAGLGGRRVLKQFGSRGTSTLSLEQNRPLCHTFRGDYTCIDRY